MMAVMNGPFTGVIIQLHVDMKDSLLVVPVTVLCLLPYFKIL